ncbi:MAG TPA: IS110 family transposase [Gammaproteobacteria bacterium]|nr:IS110 family transposase [Gammaproteobacteria bacterium]
MTHRNLIALDLAKSSIQVAVEDLHLRKVTKNRAMSVNKTKEFLVNQLPSTVAMESCGTAHWWTWFAEGLGHTVILLPPKHVVAYRQGHKTDATDNLAILEAAKRPNRKEAVKKTPNQLELQTLLSVRDNYVGYKRKLSNAIRGHLLEFGVRIPKGYASLKDHLLVLLGDAENDLSHRLRDLINRLYQSFLEAERQEKELDQELSQVIKDVDPCRRLTALEGIGPVNAVALYVMIGDGSAFKNGRGAAALIGVTPQQYSTAGIANIGHIRKTGVDKHMRALLIQGARSVVYSKRKPSTTAKGQWLQRVIERRGEGIAAVALVNKNIRTAWAMLSRGEEYVPVGAHPNQAT